MVARARQWLAWALRPPLRSKPAQLRTILRIKRTGSFDQDLYLARYPDVAAIGIDPVLHYVEVGANEGRSPGPSASGARDVEAAMKSDWDARARGAAMHFVSSNRIDWDEASFSESGRRNVEETVVADLERICRGKDPAEMRMLEIGCGIGRMTEHLAEIFGEVHGVDVSGEMISRARRRLGHRSNVFLHETTGSDLAPFGDGSFDFAFSFIVFQHVPEKEIVVTCIREVHRTLKPGALFKFQVQGYPLHRSDPGEADTWVGVSFDADELRRIAAETGFTVSAGEGEGTQYFWNWWLREN